MSLFSSIRIAGNALNVAQAGLQVTGNNIANANTPGYIRQELLQAPAPGYRVGKLVLGLGVDVPEIVQQVDRFLEDRLRGSTSDLANGEARENAYVQLETIFGELSDTDLSTALSSFFGKIHDVLNQPESAAVRNLAVLEGSALTDQVRLVDRKARELRKNVNDQVQNIAADINSLLKDVARLNVQIVNTEGGRTLGSDAVGLRDQRQLALNKLASLIDIRATEQPSGSVSVFSGGDFLVAEGTFREVTTTTTAVDRGLAVTNVQIAETGAPVGGASGKLAGLIESRDGILAGFLDQLNEFTRALMFEFNKIYSGGQGLTGYAQLTSEFSVTNPAGALDQAGLKFTPTNGAFQLQVFNKQTGITQTKDIFVQLNGLDDDTTLSGLAAAIDAIDGVSAKITPTGALTITSDSSDLSFAFAGDTSGVLAALGLNSFFSGSTASDIGVSNVLRKDPSKFAASRGGIGADTDTAVALASLLDIPLASLGGASLSGLYDRLSSDVTHGAAASKAVAEGFRVFQKTLEGQQLAISGVSIDEEAIKMIMYQRAFQASAKFISTISDLLDELVRL
jgi:flagellar hook-associated protein 1 FlgK